MSRRVIKVSSLKIKKLTEKQRIKKVEKLTKWKEMTKRKDGKDLKDERCPICLDDFFEDDRVIVRLKCDKKCCYHRDCIIRCYNAEKDFIKCPCCSENFGVQYGPMPPGYKCGTIQITYHFPGGTQNIHHPNPGKHFSGTSRTAYLPDNKIGNVVLDKLIIAFERRHTFRVGKSVTTSKDNTTVWNGLHHKTSPSGGYAQFGFPDENYFDRVMSELWHKNIK